MNRRRFLELLATLPFVRLPIREFTAEAGDVTIPQCVHVKGLDEPGDWQDMGGVMMVWDAANVVFVSEDGDDANDGLSLETAKRTLAAALLV